MTQSGAGKAVPRAAAGSVSGRRPEDLPPLSVAGGGGGGKPFSTARIGIDGEGHQDHVKRREAWEAEHDGRVRFDAPGEWSAYLPGGVPFPLGGPAPWGLGPLMDRLDRAERDGRCPAHQAAS